MALHARALSWLNGAEIELSVLSRQRLDRRFAKQAALEEAVTAWQSERNAAQTTIDWRFTAEDACLKLERWYPVLDIIRCSPTNY